MNPEIKTHKEREDNELKIAECEVKLDQKSHQDKQTLWNAVEKIEKHPEAQLTYSFDIALQNELTEEENLSLAREFLQTHFINRGMIVDFAMHDPDREEGIQNPHFHVLCPIRPMDESGKRGMKQRRVYELDEGGNRIRDADGKDKSIRTRECRNVTKKVNTRPTAQGKLKADSIYP